MEGEFKLESPTGKYGHGGARAGAGRPRKTLRQRYTEMNFRMARGEWPEIFAGILKLAKGVNKPHPTILEFRAATWLGERFFPEPRGAPVSVNISQLGGAQLVEALQSGEITPSDAATLMRAKAGVVDLQPTAVSNGNGSAREQLAERLQKLLACRQPSDAETPVDRTAGTEPATEADLDEDIEMDISEEELKASVSSAVMESLRKRGFVE